MNFVQVQRYMTYFWPTSYATARVPAIWPCVRLCLSVTSRCSIETDERIELVFGMGASIDLSNTVL